MILLSILFNFLFPSAILSISEDQFGEFDWTRTNIGYIDKIIYQVSINFVPTTTLTMSFLDRINLFL
jgi:hypothetical protein